MGNGAADSTSEGESAVELGATERRVGVGGGSGGILSGRHDERSLSITSSTL